MTNQERNENRYNTFYSLYFLCSLCTYLCMICFLLRTSHRSHARLLHEDMQPDQLGKGNYIQYIFTTKFHAGICTKFFFRFQRQSHFAAEVIFQESQNFLESCFDRQPEGAVNHDIC